jgi:acyl-CoA synthetase (NDP forming)/GNAT superfamily N-acetyltransferase
MTVTAVPDGVRALLTDGEVVRVRVLVPSDVDEVLELHRRLSERDTYFRFFGFARDFLPTIARRITRESDQKHVALGAYQGDVMVGVAHYETLAEPHVAEIAFVVDGAVQARGLGTLLLEHLASVARHRGVRRFVAEVLAENQRMLHLIADAGLTYRTRTDGPESEIVILLDEDDRYLSAVGERERVSDVASLAAVLRPASVVVVGAGRAPGSVGHAVLRKLVDGGYSGTLSAVNPHAEEIAGVRCWPSVAEVSGVVDLAVVCLPAAAVPDAVERCGRHGVRAVVVISAGLSNSDLGAQVLASVRRHGMRLVGPNCVGVVNTEPAVRLDATFTRGPVPAGRVGVVTQSGGVGIAVLELLGQLGLGVSTMVSTGDKYDVSGNDMLLWWQQDSSTDAAVLYVESFGNPRKFSRLARTLARTKPVLAVRSAESAVAQQAAASHTAAAATPAVTRDALFRQAGVIAVDSVTELIDVLAAVTWQPLPGGNRVAVLSNAGGSGVLAADACVHNGLNLPSLMPATLDALTRLLPAEASVHNPVDTTAGVDAETFGACLDVLLAAAEVDAVLAVGVPTAVSDPITAATGRAHRSDKPLLVVRPGQSASVTGLPYSDSAVATASYADPSAAAKTLGRVARYSQWRREPAGIVTTPEGIRLAEARALIRGFLDTEPNGGWLPPLVTMTLLDWFGIPAVRSVEATDADHAVAALDKLGGPVVIKAIAAGVLHKSHAGGVVLGVRDEPEVRAAVDRFRDRFGDALQGVLVQPMAEPGREMIIGVESDEVFGPLVVFGLGGTDTDLIADRAARLTPLSDVDVEQLVHDLRSSAALFGSDSPDPLPVKDIIDLLTRVGHLADALSEVVELDLNPVVVRHDGCVVLDARVRLASREPVNPYLRRLRS